MLPSKDHDSQQRHYEKKYYRPRRRTPDKFIIRKQSLYTRLILVVFVVLQYPLAHAAGERTPCWKTNYRHHYQSHTFTKTRLHYNSPTIFYNIRGGAWRPRDRSLEEPPADEGAAATSSSLPTSETMVNAETDPTTSSSTSSSWSSSIASIFSFHNQLKAQASMTSTTTTPLLLRHTLPATPSNRGGAMVLTARQQIQRPKIPSWLLQSSLVSSWTAQWNVMEVASSEAAASATASIVDVKDDEANHQELQKSALQGDHDKVSNENGQRKRGIERQVIDAISVSTSEDEDDEEEQDESDQNEEEVSDEDDLETDKGLAVTSNTGSAVSSSLSNLTSTLYAQNFSLSADSEAETASSFVSSGYWGSIDRAVTFGLAQSHPSLRVSRKLRRIRKLSARVTGMHGLLSGKHLSQSAEAETNLISLVNNDDAHMGAIRRRIAAITRARENLARFTGAEVLDSIKGKRAMTTTTSSSLPLASRYEFVLRQSPEEEHVERLRKERVREIDLLIVKSQKLLQDLACEKDVLQRRHNPLWNYTADEDLIRNALNKNETLEATKSNDITFVTTREFSFPPQDLVDEYLDMLFSSGRIVKLNHTDLWRNSDSYFDEDDDDDDELSSPLDDDFVRQRARTSSSGGGAGSWLLRNGLGEKIGEAVETAGYKAVCQAVMSVLARGLAALHGVNIMKYSDIALSMESVPDLPPLAAGIIPSSGKSINYAQGAIERAMKRGAKRRKSSRRNSDFIQRDAVVETLLSHCQISAPLLTLFPIVWQRALLGNIITMVAAVITDFFEGVELQILGHRLSFSFKPISESDLLRQLGSVGDSFDRRDRAGQDEFEAAVQATALDLAENLKFLDRWHERALGSGLLRQQIANLIARVVLTLADDVLSSARMDLWTAQAGGPRLIAGLEYRQ